jgi:SCP-2 sterol transfer family
VGTVGITDPTELEDIVRARLAVYWPYCHGDPTFDSRNTRSALPDLPPPRVDRAMLARLIRFGRANDWGRMRRTGRLAQGDSARYLEEFFPCAVRQSSLARLRLTVAVALEVRGPGGGRWTFCWRDGELCEATTTPEVIYRVDEATLSAVARGWENADEAFLSKKIEIIGNIEKGLKLAVLFGQFVREFPYRPEEEEVRTNNQHMHA